MALRKQILKEASDIPSGSQQIDKNTQEDEDDQDDNDELSSSPLPSSSRGKHKRERANKPKEMTEEEMMDLALRLSEQEASVTAIRLQQEEEAMMKAIEESMSSQTQSQIDDAETAPRVSALGSRRKHLYSNGKTVSGIDRGASEEVCTPEMDLDQGAKGTGHQSNSRNKKRKRKEGSPLLEIQDLTQKMHSQASPCSSECLSVRLDSPQSSDSIQIDDCPLPKSPVFPSTGCRAEVHVPQLSQHLLETCRTSGFVLCSQDGWTATPKSPPAQPQSPKRPNDHTLSKSPVFSETDQGEDWETEPCPEYFKSPVFGRNTHETSPRSACKPQVSVRNSGFMFSSQDSLTPSVGSCRPGRPVFPRSPGLPQNFPPPESSATCKSPIFSETGEGKTEQSRGCRTSPVFGRTGRRRKIHLREQKRSGSPSAAEVEGSDGEGNSTTTGRDPSQSAKEDSKTDHNRDDRFTNSSKSDDAEEKEEQNEISKEWSSDETKLTSDMTLLWSDDDVTPVGSPSPVFPEERPQQADSEEASWNHVSAASPGINCRPSPSSSSAGRQRQQLATTSGEPQPISRQGAVSRASSPPGEPAGGPTVCYYWGVPFCPRGVDPDKYTQVILGQMEMYEKSLKQAQRCLLRKAEWGEAVLPQPEKSPSPEPVESPQPLAPRRRGLRLGGKKRCERDETSPAEEEEDGDGARDEEEGERKEEEEKEEEEEEGDGEGRVDTDDCEVCPETQLSDDDDDRTQDLMMADDGGTEHGFEFDRKTSPEPPEVEMILRDDSQAGDEQQEEEMEEMEVEVEVDALVDRKTRRSIPAGSVDVRRRRVKKEPVKEDRGDPDVEVKDGGLPRSTSPEVEPAATSQSQETKVDCPICQGSFPASEIERHAAYCDGEVAVVDERRSGKDCFQVLMKPRRKRTRRAEATDEETQEPSNTDKNQEKCYICQKTVALRDYSRHTELCIQRQTSKTKGNLLSALDQTESRDSEAGPSGSQLHPGEVIVLLDDEEEEEEEGGGASAIRISNSPIRSFTPISELTGCLIDFKKQQRPKKLRQRRR